MSLDIYFNTNNIGNIKRIINECDSIYFVIFHISDKINPTYLVDSKTNHI